MHTQRDISIYIHIPFCTKKCPYCHFYVIADNERLKDTLLQALIEEIKLYREKFADRRIVSIYFGGGTPSLFGPSRIEKLLEQFSFEKSCEITLEANPEDASRPFIQSFRNAGINRISFGVQSLHDHELHILGRIHSSEKAKAAIYATADAGINNISLDLMYETPNQTLESFTASLLTAASLPITHLSLYNLTFEEGTLFLRNETKLRPLIVDDEEGALMYKKALELLPQHGLIQYEVSAFCRNNQLSIHNTGYWTGREFLGFGPSAFSYFEAKRFRNIANLPRYAALIHEGSQAVDFTDDVDPIKRKKEFFALNLRLTAGVSLLAFTQQFGPLDAETEASIAKLIARGLLKKNNDHIAMTPLGLLFYDTIASEII